MKKSLFLLGMALLSVSSLFADTVEHNGVTYETGSAVSDVKTQVREAYEVTVLNTGSAASMGYVSFDYTKELDLDEQKTYNLSVLSFPKSFTLEGWTEGPSDTNYSNRQTNTTVCVDGGYVYTTAEFKKYAGVIKSLYKNFFHDFTTVSSLDESVLDSVKFVYHNKSYSWTKVKSMSSEKTSAYLYYYLMNTSWNDFEECWDVGVGSIIIIDKLYTNYTEKSACNTTTQYVYNTVATGVDWSGATNITLGSTITSVADGAFATATDLKSFASNSTSFTVDDNGFLCTKGYEKLVAVPAYTTSGTTLSGTTDAQAVYNLNDNTTAVATNALANVSYVDIVSGIQIEASIGGTGNRLYSNGTQELKSGNSITSLVKSELISFTEKPTGIIGSGVLTKASLAKLISEHASDNMSYIDLSGENLPSGASLTTKQTAIGEVTGLPTNCLLFLPRGVTATGDNVIIGGANGSCKNLVVADGTQFFSPYDFSAETATYSGRTFTENKFSTIILPFDVTGSTYVEVNGTKALFDGSNNGAFRVASLNSYATNGEIKFQYQDVLSQNKAYLLKANETFSKFVVSNGVSVKTTPTSMATEKSNSDGAIAVFAGSFSKGTTLSSYATGTAAYGLTTTGDIKKVATGKLVTLNPYRAMFLLTEPTTTSEAKHTIRIFEDADAETGEEVIEDVTATDIEYASVKSADINVVPQTGKIIVTANGDFVTVANVAGASCFSGKVNGQQSIELPAGVYVVNGKKYIVK